MPQGILLAAALITAQGFAQSPPTISLEQSLADALQYSSRLHATAEQVAAQRAIAQDAIGARFPSLIASGAYVYTSEVAALDLALPIPTVPPVHKELGDGNVYDFALTARAPLFMGGTLRERAQAEQSALRATEWDLATDSFRVMYDVRRAYFNALGAEKRAAAARQSAERLQRHWNELQGALKAGMASEEMNVKTEARWRQAEAVALGAEADAHTARLQLANLVGKPGLEVTPEDRLDAPIVNDIPPTDISSRHEIAAVDARIVQSQHLARAACGSLLPALSAQAAYHYAKPGVDQFKNDWMDYGTLGVNLSWTLWDWNMRSARVSQARAGLRSWEARKQDLADALQTQLTATTGTVQSARDALGKADERLALEHRHFEMVQGRFQIGTTSESEFLDAQDDLTAAELDRAAAAVRLRLAEADWLNAAGR
jgi:outer membrane protein TolC